VVDAAIGGSDSILSFGSTHVYIICCNKDVSMGQTVLLDSAKGTCLASCRACGSSNRLGYVVHGPMGGIVVGFSLK
jgi:hypothetical protein